MNAGGEDDGDVAGGNAVFDQPSHDQVHDLRAARCPCRVGNDNQHRVAGDDLVG